MAIHIHRGEAFETICPNRGERILYCGLRHGIVLPYECGTGTCGTCKAVLEDGEVELRWPQAPGMRYVREQRNEYLLCQCVAKSDEVHIRTRPARRFPIALPVPKHFRGEIFDQRLLNPLVCEFVLRVDADIEYLPGQYVTLEHPDIHGYRAYSMTKSYSLNGREMHFVVKRTHEGKFTNWLFEGDRTGAQFSGFGPLGRAVPVPESERDIVALAGGTGIAGIMAIVDWAVACGHLQSHQLHLVFGLQNLDDQFFFARLDELCAQWRNLTVTVALTDDRDVDSAKLEYGALAFGKGYLHEVAAHCLGDLSSVTTVFIAGPPPAVDASLKMLVKERKHPASKIRFDKFG